MLCAYIQLTCVHDISTRWLPFHYVGHGLMTDSNTPTTPAQLSPTTNATNLFHYSWHGYFTGPEDYSGVRIVLTSRT